MAASSVRTMLRMLVCRSAMNGPIDVEMSTRKYRSSGVGFFGRSSTKSSVVLFPTARVTLTARGATVPGLGGGTRLSPTGSGGISTPGVTGSTYRSREWPDCAWKLDWLLRSPSSEPARPSVLAKTAVVALAPGSSS